MASPVSARTALSGGGALLLGGVLGLGLWAWLRRSDRNRHPRLARVWVAVAAGGLVLIAVGAVSRVVTATDPPLACASPSGTPAQTGGRPLSAAVLGEKVATTPETGLAMLYVRAIGVPECRSASTDYYVAVHGIDIAGGRAVNMGDIVVSPRYDLTRQEMLDLAAHEARHRSHWAVATVLGGPFAFPVAYGIDDFFFPGARNHFERQAGLSGGGYAAVGHRPVLGPPQIAALCAVPMAIAAAWVLRSRRSRRARRAPDSTDEHKPRKFSDSPDSRPSRRACFFSKPRR